MSKEELPQNKKREQIVEHVLLIGTGAIGILHGYLLEKSGKIKVTAICRSNYDTMKDSGITIKSSSFGSCIWRPHRVMRSIEEASDREYNYAVCAFKCLPDVIPTERVLGEVLTRVKCVVLLQNGVGIERSLQMARPDIPIISGIVWVGVNIRDNILVHEDFEKLYIGIYKNVHGRNNAELVNHFAELMGREQEYVIVKEHIQQSRWHKLLWNATFNTLATLSGLPMRRLMRGVGVLPIAKSIMDEIAATAAAIGIDLPEETISDSLDMTMKYYGDIGDYKSEEDFKPSMLIDYEMNRPMEIECILGEVVRMAGMYRVPVPHIELAYFILKIKQVSLVGAV
ncbi:hypothetical protein E3Q14_03504 [Wallemia mellicola]|nr:hypothetical protein E3Q14_03504 [Wallemia mellicola]TIC51047.1 hypothetical protein E3Q05_03241 [Wallemia mellicola]